MKKLFVLFLVVIILNLNLLYATLGASCGGTDTVADCIKEGGIYTYHDSSMNNPAKTVVVTNIYKHRDTNWKLTIYYCDDYDALYDVCNEQGSLWGEYSYSSYDPYTNVLGEYGHDGGVGSTYSEWSIIDPSLIPSSGCMDQNASNYNSTATFQLDGDCQYSGCMDQNASNYNSIATFQLDGDCQYEDSPENETDTPPQDAQNRDIDRTQVSSCPSYPTKLKCENDQNCQEIDEAFSQIASLVGGSGDVWMPDTSGGGEWKDYNDLYCDRLQSFSTSQSNNILYTSSSIGYPVQSVGCGPGEGQSITNWGTRPNLGDCHDGLDFTASKGTKIYSILDGTVDSIKTGCINSDTSCGGGAGNYVKIKHNVGGIGFVSIYAHLSSVSVTAGSTISKGQKIGEAGDTGYSFGSHLHLSIRVDGTSGSDNGINPVCLYKQFEINSIGNCGVISDECGSSLSSAKMARDVCE